MFGTKAKQSLALIEITSGTVSAAYARVQSGSIEIVYGCEVTIAKKESVPDTVALIRAVGEALEDLVAKGGPLLRQATGSGAVEDVRVNVGYPWQTSSIATKTKREEKPFLFTREVLQELLKEETNTHISNTEIVATLLNGYQVQHPFGKMVKRADIVVLKSTMEAEMADMLRKTLRHAGGGHTASISAFAPIARGGIAKAFPHEEDYVAIRISSHATEVAFVQKGYLVDAAAAPPGLALFTDSARMHGVGSLRATESLGTAIINTKGSAALAARMSEAETTWTKALIDILKKSTANRALPRLVFLFAPSDAREFVKRMLDSHEVRALWLSDEPLRIVPVLPKHLGAVGTEDALGPCLLAV